MPPSSSSSAASASPGASPTDIVLPLHPPTATLKEKDRERDRDPLSPPNLNRDRRFRILLLVSLVVVIVLLLHLTATTSLSRSHLLGPSTSFSAPPCSDPSHSQLNARLPVRIDNETRLRQITQDNRNLVYLHPPIDAVLMTMAKAGTSTTWHWLYPGVTGKPKWNMTECQSYVHEMRSPCWKGHASYLHQLPIRRQWDLLSSSSSSISSTNSSNSSSSSSNSTTNTNTLRIAIQRNPYDRVISSFKSKFTCEHDRFGTDVHDRRKMVPLLRKRCQLPPSPADCMNISDFASALDSCRRNKDVDLDILDNHIKPQNFFFDEIPYDMVIDVADLSDVRVLRPLIDRIPQQNRHLVKDGPRLRHASGSDELDIPEKAAHMLYSYALQSLAGKLKYIPGAEPSASRDDIAV